MLGAVVDEFFASVNETIIPHFFEGGIDAVNDVFVESKSKVIPRAGSAESAKLEFHIATLLGDKIPDSSVEFVAVEFKTSMALLFEILFVNNPGFEASVVGAWNIPRRFAFEAIIANEGIFGGYGEAVTDVEVSVGVRGWHDDGKIGGARSSISQRARRAIVKITTFRRFLRLVLSSLGIVNVVILTVGVCAMFRNATF